MTKLCPCIEDNFKVQVQALERDPSVLPRAHLLLHLADMSPIMNEINTQRLSRRQDVGGSSSALSCT